MTFRSFKKDIDKIYQKIDKIAKLGRDSFQEYYNYIDEVITKQQYGVFTQVLLIKYNFDCTKILSIDEVKQRSWPAILFQTNTKFQDDKYALLKSNNIYQLGLNYLSGTYSLGTINEVDKYVVSIDPLAYTDNLFQQTTENKITYLSVDKSGSTRSMTFSTWNFSYSYDKNLLNLYKEAISYLI
jgi:hypothetical protein